MAEPMEAPEEATEGAPDVDSAIAGIMQGMGALGEMLDQQTPGAGKAMAEVMAHFEEVIGGLKGEPQPAKMAPEGRSPMKGMSTPTF